MSDAVFYLLDALLAAAKGMLAGQRAEAVKEEFGLKEDPRSKLSQVFTSPVGAALTSLIGAYFVNKDLVTNAKDQTAKRRYF